MLTFSTIVLYILLLVLRVDGGERGVMDLSPRDLGGRYYDTLEVSTRHHPSVAMIVSKDGDGKVKHIICTGSLLTMRWVLTAAQCFYYDNENYFKICAGYDSLEEMTAASGANCRDTYDIQLRSYFYGGCCKYDEDDIAVVNVQRPFEKTGRVLPIPLSDKPLEVGHYHDCFVVGFCTPLLRVRSVHVTKNCYCTLKKPRWEDDEAKPIRAPFMCFNENDRAKSSRQFCEGDQGAGLVCDGRLYGVFTALLNSSFYDTCLRPSWTFINGTTFGQKVNPMTAAFVDTCIHLRWINSRTNLFETDEVRKGGCIREEKQFDKVRAQRKNPDRWYWGPAMKLEDKDEDEDDEGGALTGLVLVVLSGVTLVLVIR